MFPGMSDFSVHISSALYFATYFNCVHCTLMLASTLHQEKFRQHTIQVVGPDLKIETSQCNQQVYIDLRKYFQVADSADFLPSRRGIHLPLPETAKFVTALKDIKPNKRVKRICGEMNVPSYFL
jgi:hypothetical protein